MRLLKVSRSKCVLAHENRALNPTSSQAESLLVCVELCFSAVLEKITICMIQRIHKNKHRFLEQVSSMIDLFIKANTPLFANDDYATNVSSMNNTRSFQAFYLSITPI